MVQFAFSGIVHCLFACCLFKKNFLAIGSLVYGLGYSFSPNLRFPGEIIYLGGLGYQVYLVGLTAYQLLY